MCNGACNLMGRNEVSIGESVPDAVDKRGLAGSGCVVCGLSGMAEEERERR